MTFATLLTLAVGLSMDATAVAAARGLSARNFRASDAAKVALLFGGFQGVMPALGYWLGARFGSIVANAGHWIAFAILALLGAKMIHEARGGDDVESSLESRSNDAFAWPALTLLAVATSIDAFAAGISLFLLAAPIFRSASIIALTTAVLSWAGVHAGRRFGRALGKRLEVAGGVVLIGLGLKLLVEHFVAS